MDKIVRVNSDEYEIVRLLGHGKGGYSYLALSNGKEVVLKHGDKGRPAAGAPDAAGVQPPA